MQRQQNLEFKNENSGVFYKLKKRQLNTFGCTKKNLLRFAKVYLYIFKAHMLIHLIYTHSHKLTATNNY